MNLYGIGFRLPALVKAPGVTDAFDVGLVASSWCCIR